MTRNETVLSPFLWIPALLGVGAGLAVVRLAEMPDRWVIAALGGLLILPAILATARPRRAALFVFVFSLQIGLALYVTDPPPASSVGASWPNSLALPFSSLTAIVALAFGWRRPFVWHRGMTACAGLLALTTAASIPGSAARFIGLSHLLLLAAYFLILVAASNAVHDSRDLELVRRGLMASLALQSLIYFGQILAGATFTPSGEWIDQSGSLLGRYGGLVGTRPAIFCSFLLPLLLLALSDFLTCPQRLGDGLVVALGCAALILTFTRASWMAFALGVLYLLAAGARRAMVVRRKVAALLVLLLLVALALAPKILMRAAEDHRAAFEERWALVQMALRVIQANPLVGVGAGAYPYAFRDYLNPELADKWLFVVHNVFILRAAETGLPGLAALLAFLYVAFRAAAPERLTDPAARRMALGWRAGLIALCWEMLWDVSLGPAANALLWFLCGVMVAARSCKEEQIDETMALHTTPGRDG